MEDRIREVVNRAIGNIVYSIWGSVKFETVLVFDYKKFALAVWDKSYKCKDKKVIVYKQLEWKSENEFEIKNEIISKIEAYLIENYS